MTMLKELAREYWANRPMELATVEGRIVTEMRLLVGAEGSEVVQTVVRHASDPEKGALSVVIGIAVLFLGATTVFVQLQSSLNRIWKVDESAHVSVLWVFVKERLLSLAWSSRSDFCSSSHLSSAPRLWSLARPRWAG